MCLIAFAIDADPACPLLIAANRDEALERPTATLHHWTLPGGQAVLGGRDLKDGGTWLGATPTGRVAMLTNVREALPAQAPRSRGELATRWLQGDGDWESFCNGLSATDYGGFNLVVGDFERRFWACVSNRSPRQPHHDTAPRLHRRLLGAGVYGLSNAALDTPWPKTLKLKQALTESLVALAGDAEAALCRLTETLGDLEWATDGGLPSTGVPLPVERVLSSPFVRAPERQYGTRSSLVLRVTPAPTPAPIGAERLQGAWQVRMDEWTHVHSDLPTQGRRVAFQPAQRKSESLNW